MDPIRGEGDKEEDAGAPPDRTSGVAKTRPAAEAVPAASTAGFVGMLVKELENPVAALDACLLLLSDLNSGAPEDTEATLDAMRDALEVTRAVMAELRQVPAAVSPREPSAAVRIGVLLDEIVESIRASRAPRPAFALDMPSTTLLHADAGMLRCCLSYLLRRLAQHARATGRVRVTGTMRRGAFVLRMTGVRAEPAGSPESSVAPSGVASLRPEALDFCRAIVRAHSGDLAVHQGPGGTLQVTLMLAGPVLGAVS